ncbi:hypothetical protein AUC45_06945 [Erythrobacter sp. YT30]|nr:hypothetical protein AUC45_06945 [Erythrobacter sp. YT30]
MVQVDRQVELSVTFYQAAKHSRGTILFCPGLGATQVGFASDAVFFAEQGYDCVTVDLRGFGESSRPPQLTLEQYSLERLALDIIAILDGTKLRTINFVGNSLGGVIGLEIIRLRPNALTSLVTFGTTYQLDIPGWMVSIQNVTSYLLGRKALAYFVAKSSSRHQHTREIVREMFSSFPNDIGRLVSMNVGQYDYRSIAGKWNRPILLLTGDNDRGINQKLAPTLAALSDKPAFHYQMIPNAGHFANLDNPRGFRQALLNFL